MKLLYFGDKHERVTKPESRLDSNYKETEFLKTREIVSLGKQHNVKAYLQPGDFFDAPNPPLNYVADVVREWSSFNFLNSFSLFQDILNGKKSADEVVNQLKNHTPLVGVAGNHELYGNNLSSLPSTMIGFLNKIGMMHFATKDNPYIIEGENGFKVAITGTHYHLDIDKEGHEEDYIVREKLGDIHIHIVHGMLTDTSKGTLYHHTLIDDIAPHTKADLTISGHDHIGFPITEVDGKYFVNPGAVMRNSSDLREMKRKPKVLLIDIDESTGKLKLEEIYLKSARKGEEVLSREKLERQRAREMQLEEFRTSVRQANVQKGLDLEQILKNISTNKKVSDEIVNELLNLTAKKREEINDNSDGYATDVYVERVILENFQSHTYTDIKLDRHMNVLVGDSGNGKSAMQRGFRWVYANQPAGKRIIQRGKDYAKVRIFLSNGTIITRIVERKASGKNGFEIYTPSTGETEYFNTTYLGEVQKLMGLKPYVLDKDKVYLMNFMKQGSGWFLLNASDRERAKIIGGVYQSHIADSVSREMDKNNARAMESIKKSEAELKDLSETIKTYSDLDEQKRQLLDIKSKMAHYQQLVEKVNRIRKIIEEKALLEQKLAESRRIINGLSNLEAVYQRLDRLKTNAMLHDVKDKTVHRYLETNKRFGVLLKTIEHTNHIENASKRYKELVEKVANYEKAKSLMLTHKDIQSKLIVSQETIRQTENINIANQRLKHIQTEMMPHFEKISSTLPTVLEKEKELATRKRKFEVLNRTINDTKHIDEAKARLAKVKEMKAKLETLTSLTTTHRELLVKKEHATTEIEKAGLFVSEQESILAELWDELGTCPFCKQSVSRELVHNH